MRCLPDGRIHHNAAQGQFADLCVYGGMRNQQSADQYTVPGTAPVVYSAGPPERRGITRLSWITA